MPNMLVQHPPFIQAGWLGLVSDVTTLILVAVPLRREKRCWTRSCLLEALWS